MLELCPPQVGQHILGVGCGLGHEVRRLSQLTGPGGRVVGVDKNVAMIAEARSRNAEASLPVDYILW